MIKMLKILKWDIQKEEIRFYYIFFLIRNFPGNFGMAIRKSYLEKYLNKSGANLRVHQGVHIRNVNHIMCGDNVTFGFNNFFQAAGWIVMGNDVLLGPDVKIWTSNHIFEDPYMPVRLQGYEEKKVNIGNN